MVWGSGPSSPDHAKRLQIRDHLAKRFGAEKVFLSEDPEFEALTEKYGLATAEAIQAGSIDALIVLDTSIGPHSELLLYGDIILSKAIVFVEESRKESQGFARVAYDALKTEAYTAEEYRSCENIRRKANDFAQAMRLRKARRKELGGLFGS